MALNLFGLPLWERHEERVLATFKRALVLLSTKRPQGVGEDDLNRELYFCVLEAMRELHETDLRLDHPPTWDSRNPPNEDAEAGAAWKRPDFYWGYVDHSADDPRRAARNFVVECKRVGPRSDSGWVFNRRYVTDGVLRFVDPEWGYGRDTSSGAMVGYVEGMKPEDALVEVNAEANARHLPEIVATDTHSPIREHTHALPRSFEGSPYVLAHLWLEP